MKNKLTEQEKFWSSDFGKKYTSRNTFNPREWDQYYKKFLGTGLRSIMKDFLGNLKIGNTLEIGCNIGNQLRLLQSIGLKNLYGIDIQHDAVERAKHLTKKMNIIQGSALDLPFRNDYFDLVLTNVVLIHISPKDIKKVMSEIYRVGKKYILGFEYFSNKYEETPYRGHKNRQWRGPFAQMYLDLFPDLKLIKSKKFKYLSNDNVDMIYLLEKTK